MLIAGSVTGWLCRRPGQRNAGQVAEGRLRAAKGRVSGGWGWYRLPSGSSRYRP